MGHVGLDPSASARLRKFSPIDHCGLVPLDAEDM
jgi:hypothetical protein